MPDSSHKPQKLIRQARAGDTESLNHLLGLYRNYLNLIARGQISGKMRLRVDASDLTQDVMLLAYQSFDQFRGTTEAEMVTWLRRILVHRLTDLAKRHQAQRQDVRRQALTL